MSTMFQTQTTPSVLPATGNQLVGYGAAFNSWARISTPQGAFMEKVAPGAFRKTLQERGDKVRVLLEHGKDARAGNRPLGTLLSLREDQYGLAYVCDLFDEPYVAELKSALAANLYSSSFRFRSRVEDFEPRPPASEHNPGRIPEVVLRELELFELGPCTFPAYSSATASLRTKGAPPTLSLVPAQSRPPSPPSRTRSSTVPRSTRERGLLRFTPLPDPTKKGGPAWRL